MEISTREMPLQPGGEDVDSGYVLFPVLDEPGRFVAQFGDGSYTPYWTPKGAKLDEPEPVESSPLPVSERVYCRMGELFVFGSLLIAVAQGAGAFS